MPDTASPNGSESDKHQGDFARNRLLSSGSRDFIKQGDLSITELLAGMALEDPDNVYFPTSAIIAVGMECDKSFVGLGLVGAEGTTECIDDARHYFSYQILTEGIAYKMKATRFAELRAVEAALGKAVHEFQARMARRLATLAALTSKREITSRVALWLLWAYECAESESLAITHVTLARTIGVRRAGITDALHWLEGERAIFAKRNLLTLRDRERLEAIGSVNAWV